MSEKNLIVYYSWSGNTAKINAKDTMGGFKRKKLNLFEFKSEY